jgi:hypothetical protein
MQQTDDGNDIDVGHCLMVMQHRVDQMRGRAVLP